MLCVACVQRRSLGGIKSAANDPLVAAGALARASRCQPVVWDYPNLPRRRMHHLQRLTDPSPHNWEVQIMDLMRNSGLDPVAHRLLVELQQLRDLSDRQKLIWHALSLTEYNGSRSEQVGQLPRVKLHREPLRRPSLGRPGIEVHAVLELGGPVFDAGHDPGTLRIMLGDRERKRAHANVCSHTLARQSLLLLARSDTLRNPSRMDQPCGQD